MTVSISTYALGCTLWFCMGLVTSSIIIRSQGPHL